MGQRPFGRAERYEREDGPLLKCATATHSRRKSKSCSIRAISSRVCRVRSRRSPNSGEMINLNRRWSPRALPLAQRLGDVDAIVGGGEPSLLDRAFLGRAPARYVAAMRGPLATHAVGRIRDAYGAALKMGFPRRPSRSGRDMPAWMSS